MVEEDGFISDVSERRASGRVQTELNQERREEREREHGRKERKREGKWTKRGAREQEAKRIQA